MNTKNLTPALCALAVALTFATPALAANDTWSALTGLTGGSVGTVRQFALVAPTTMYAATDGDGIFSSSNLGVSWAPDSGGLVPGDGQEETAAMTVDTVVASGATAYAG